jgi:hypothetical protein
MPIRVTKMEIRNVQRWPVESRQVGGNAVG